MGERYNSEKEILLATKSITSLKTEGLFYEDLPDSKIYLCTIDCGINIGGRGCVFDNKKPIAIECTRNKNCPCNAIEIRKRMISFKNLKERKMTTSEW